MVGEGIERVSPYNHPKNGSQMNRGSFTGLPPLPGFQASCPRHVSSIFPNPSSKKFQNIIPKRSSGKIENGFPASCAE